MVSNMSEKHPYSDEDFLFLFKETQRSAYHVLAEFFSITIDISLLEMVMNYDWSPDQARKYVWSSTKSAACRTRDRVDETMEQYKSYWWQF